MVVVYYATQSMLSHAIAHQGKVRGMGVRPPYAIEQMFTDDEPRRTIGQVIAEAAALAFCAGSEFGEIAQQLSWRELDLQRLITRHNLGPRLHQMSVDPKWDGKLGLFGYPHTTLESYFENVSHEPIVAVEPAISLDTYFDLETGVEAIAPIQGPKDPYWTSVRSVYGRREHAVRRS